VDATNHRTRLVTSSRICLLAPRAVEQLIAGNWTCPVPRYCLAQTLCPQGQPNRLGGGRPHGPSSRRTKDKVIKQSWKPPAHHATGCDAFEHADDGGEVGMSKATVCPELGCEWLQPNRVGRPSSIQKDKRSWKAHDVVGLYLNPPSKRWYVRDEKSQVQALDRTQRD